MKCLPKLPVPPVTSTDFSFRSIQGWVKSRRGAAAAADLETSGAMASAAGLMQFPLLGQHGRLMLIVAYQSVRERTKNAANDPEWCGLPKHTAQALVPRPTP